MAYLATFGGLTGGGPYVEATAMVPSKFWCESGFAPVKWRGIGNNVACVSVWWGTGGGSAMMGSYMDWGYGYIGQNGQYKGTWFDNSLTGGTISMEFYAINGDYIIDTWGSIRIAFRYYDGGGDAGIWKVFCVQMPSMTIAQGGTLKAVVGIATRIGTVGAGFPDVGGTFRCNLYTTTSLGSRIYAREAIDLSESFDLEESRPDIDVSGFAETAVTREWMAFNPRRYAVETVPIYETLEQSSVRVGSVVNWNFSPSFRVFFEQNINQADYATTNWHGRISQYGNIRKSVKHWTGDYEVGNWTPTFADPDNELFGSMYGAGSDARGHSLILKTLISDTPVTYHTQYRGAIERTGWNDGELSIDFTDKMADLPLRWFNFDYQNLGSHTPTREWGIVKRIIGTQVMFDDYGDIKWVEVKRSGGNLGMLIIQSLLAGGVTGLAGMNPWLGAGAFGLSFLAGLSGLGEKLLGGYYRITDFNMIPDDTVRSGAVLRFYYGSVNGDARNSSGPLEGLKDYVVQGGTMRQGIWGTVELLETSGIKVGDYVYLRKPLAFGGDPDMVIRGILCGSNINQPYVEPGGEWKISVGWFGTHYYYVPSDFATTWATNIVPVKLMEVGKIIAPNDETTPFEEVKQLCKEIQLTFFLDENDKFNCQTIRPRGIVTDANVATYTEARILDGMNFDRTSEGVVSGINIWYDYAGQGGVLNSGYNRLLQMDYPGTTLPNARRGTLQCQWLKQEDDARQVGWNYLLENGEGCDRLTLPTTLYGVTHSLGDLIRVTATTGSLNSRLFEIEAYDKQFDDDRVILEAVDVQRIYGRGYATWFGSSGLVGTDSLSGMSLFNNGTFRVGTFSASWGTIYSYQDYLYAPYQIGPLWKNRWLAVGTEAQNAEIFYAKEVWTNTNVSTVHVIRGLFGQVRRTWFDIPIFQIGAVTFRNGQPVPDQFDSSLATTYGISPNNGTSFRFF